MLIRHVAQMGLCKSKPVRPTVRPVTIPLSPAVTRPRLPVHDKGTDILWARICYFVHCEHPRIEQFKLLVPGLDNCHKVKGEWYTMSISLVYIVCSDAVPILQRWWRKTGSRRPRLHKLAILHTTMLSTDMVELIARYL